MYRSCLAVCFALALVWGFGCSGRTGPAPTADVKGTVTMDGKPLPEGELHFSVTGYPPSVLKVANGTFKGQAPIGQNRVELFIYVDAPAHPKYSAEGASGKMNTSPGKYWGPNTALDAGVSATSVNDLKFDLKSK